MVVQSANYQSRKLSAAEIFAGRKLLQHLAPLNTFQMNKIWYNHKKWANPVPFHCTSLIKSLFNNKCLLPLVKEKRETKAYGRQNSPCRAYASLHQLLNRSCCESLWRDVRAAKNVCSPFVCEHLKVKSSPAKGFDLLFHFSFLLFRIFQSCQQWKVLWRTGCHAHLNVHLDPRKRRVGGSLIVIMMIINIFIISMITWGVGQPAKRVAGLRHSVRSKISRNGREKRSPWPHTLPWRGGEGEKCD